MILKPKLNELVSPRSSMNTDDALEAKKALNRIGKYEPPEWGMSGIPDQRIFDGLAQFQTENGLAADREMRPGGATHRTLTAALDEKDNQVSAPALAIGAEVGPRGVNAAQDVQKVRAGLASLDYLPDREVRKPEADFDLRAASALGKFQMDYNLKWDQTARASGPSIKTLEKVTAPMRRRSFSSTAMLRPEQPASPARRAREVTGATMAKTRQPSRLADLKPRDPFEEDRFEQLGKLADLLRRDQPLNEPDSMLGVTVLEALGEDRSGPMSPRTAAKLFKLSALADQDDDVRDIWNAVGDPEFPVRRGRVMLGNGDLVEFDQTEANGDDDGREPRLAMGAARLILRALAGGASRAPKRRPVPPVALPPESLNQEHEGGDDGGSGKQTPHDAQGDDGSFEIEEGVALKEPNDANEKHRGTIVGTYGSIDDPKGKEIVGEAMNGATLTTDKDARPGISDITSPKPAEAADQMVDDIAESHGEIAKEHDGGGKTFTGPDGTKYTSYDRTSGGRGTEVVVTINPDRFPGKQPKSGRGRIKFRFGTMGKSQ